MAEFGMNKGFKKHFLFNFAIALLLYLPFLTYWLTNGDGSAHSLFYKRGYAWEISLGRFGLPVFDKLFRGRIILPQVSTLLSLILLDLTILLICRLFRVEKPLYRALISLVLIAAPTVSNTLTYYYCSDAYFLAYFLSVLAVCLFAGSIAIPLAFNKNSGEAPSLSGQNEDPGARKKTALLSWIAGALCITVSLSLYQAYLVTAVSLCLLFLLYRAAADEGAFVGGVPAKDFKTQLLRMLTGGAAGSVLYLILFWIIRHMTGIEASAAHGVDEAVSGVSAGFFGRIAQSYRDFFRYLLTDQIINNSWRYRDILNFCIFVLILVLLIHHLRQFTPQMLTRWLCVFAGILLLPMALGAMAIIAPKAPLTGETGLLTVMQMNFPYVLLAVLVSESGKLDSREFHILRGISVGISALLISVLLLYTAVFTHVLRLNLNKGLGTGERIISAVEASGLYEGGVKLMVGGAMERGNYPEADPELTRIVKGSAAEYTMFWDSGMQSECWAGFLKANFGVVYDYVDIAEHNKLLKEEEYALMPDFPAEGSIRRIGDVLVVKLSD